MASWFSSLKAGLSKTSERLGSGLRSFFQQNRLSSATLESLEELLLTSDMGLAATEHLIAKVKSVRLAEGDDITPLLDALAQGITDILSPHTKPLTLNATSPTVVLVCGVNGNGKTTTIAKLAHYYQQQGKQVMLAACDTFRAAAVEQLAIWAERLHCTCIQGAEKEDPASVAYRALEQAMANGTDLLLIDTAGRLHTQHNLMAELGKISQVLRKRLPAAPHHTLLVLDATTGQNAFRQVEMFKQAANITGLIITKLDGSARGGVVVGLAKEFALPIHAIGVGETLEDLRPFEAESFARLMVGLDDAH